MPEFDQMSCHKIASTAVIHQDIRFFLQLVIAALNKHIWDLIFIQHLVQLDVPTEDLAFARFDDQSVNVFL